MKINSSNQKPDDWLDEILAKVQLGPLMPGYSDLAAMNDREVAKAAIKARLAEVEREALEKPNGLLRSAWQIADRDGRGTNWKTFRNQLKAELDREHTIMYPGQPHQPERESK